MRTPSDPLPQTLQCAGFELAYSVEGQGSTCFVLVPGLPGSARDFRWLAPELSGWARVVRFDPPGFGLTARTEVSGMSAVEKARVVWALLDRLQLDRVVLVGHSFGSVVAAEAAALRPGQVAGLILLAPPGVDAHFPQPLVRALGRVLTTTPGRFALRYPQRAGYRAAGFPAALGDEELTMATLDSGKADFDSYRAALDSLEVPTMIAYARDDQQVPPRNSAGLHRVAAPGPRVAFADGGHNIQKSRAGDLAELIRPFVAG